MGVHRPGWLGRLPVELMVSRRGLVRRRSWPRATHPWFLDSGGFTELGMFGTWSLSPEEYVEQVRHLSDRVGPPTWVAPMDWMAEPRIRAATGQSVQYHQRATVANFLRLRELAPELPIIPVLQGWDLPDYARCRRMYEEAGVDLGAEPLVGLGTVCRRQATVEVEDIVLSVADLSLHGFGVKAEGLARYGYLLSSADSMAWSRGGQFRKPDLHRPCPKSTCANCPEYALAWRDRVLGGIEERATQLHLTVARS